MNLVQNQRFNSEMTIGPAQKGRSSGGFAIFKTFIGKRNLQRIRSTEMRKTIGTEFGVKQGTHRALYGYSVFSHPTANCRTFEPRTKLPTYTIIDRHP